MLFCSQLRGGSSLCVYITQRATLFIWWIRSELWLANIIMHGVVHKYDPSLLVLPACIAIAYIGVADSTIYASTVHLYSQSSKADSEIASSL